MMVGRLSEIMQVKPLASLVAKELLNQTRLLKVN